MNTYKRLDLSEYEMIDLLNIVKSYEELGNEIPTTLKDKLDKPKDIKISMKKASATSEATEAKIKKVTKKIKMAIKYIEQEKKKMTYTAIAGYAEVSPITVKKYVNIVDKKAITTNNFYYYNL